MKNVLNVCMREPKQYAHIDGVEDRDKHLLDVESFAHTTRQFQIDGSFHFISKSFD